MKRVIDLLRDIDRDQLADEFMASYVTLSIVGDIMREEILVLIDDICDMDDEAINTTHAIIKYTTYFDHSIVSELRIVSINELCKSYIVDLKNIEAMPLKILVGSLVSLNIIHSCETMELLSKVLYVAFMEMWGHQIFGDLFCNEDIEMDTKNSSPHMTSDETRLFVNIERAVKELTEYYLNRELDTLKRTINDYANRNLKEIE